MWIFWALFSALLVASRRPFEKKTIGEVHHFTYGFLIQSVSLPIAIAAVLLSGKLLNPFHLGLRFWLPIIIVSAVFYPLYGYFYKLAMKDGELSKVLPLQSLWPVFGLLMAWPFLGEVPSIVATFGVVLTVLGVYALGLKGKRLHHPLQPFREDRSSRAMLAVMLVAATTSILDKIAIQASNPLFYNLTATLAAMFTLFVAMSICKQKLTRSLLPFAKQLGVIGTLQGASYTTYLLAIAAGPIAYVTALRSTNILMGSLLGIFVFNEKLTKSKIISYVLIVAGALLLTFGSSR